VRLNLYLYISGFGTEGKAVVKPAFALGNILV